MDRKNYIVIWPAYLDANKKRSEGRKINLKYAIEKIKLTEIITAAEKLGYKIEVDFEKAYPRSWWEKGCIRIHVNNEKKLQVLYKIAQKIKELRKK